MNTQPDTLFSMPEPEPLTALDLARSRYEEAKASYDRADYAEDEYGDPMPAKVAREYRDAHSHLLRVEAAECKRRI